MPPAANPVQGSRAGLVSALIVVLVVAVAMIVVAVYESQVASNWQRQYEQQLATDKPLLPDNAGSDPRVQALLAARDQFPNAPDALSVSMAESDQLAKLSAGDMPADKAADAIRTQLKAAVDQVNGLKGQQLVDFTIPPNVTLASAVTLLTDHVATLAHANKDKQDQLEAEQQKTQAAIKEREALGAQKDQAIAQANARAEAAEADAKRAHEEATAATQGVQASANSNLKQEQQVVASLTGQLQSRDKQITDLGSQIRSIKQKLHLFRVNTNEPIVQHADGTIINITDQKTVYINIGSRQQVTKGLTFEVYDKNKGIPPLGDGMAEGDMPIGKASIEVYNVGPDSSECRIVKLQPGEQLVVGDLLVNLVYDPNVHYNFVVFGDFDLSNTGAASPTDAEIIKRLITQWGGRIQGQVDVDTDFVVMGKEPDLPSVDQNDPQSVLRFNQAKQRLDSYEMVKAKATQLSIPIMNQNRFLYFVGYYDQATR